MDSPDLQMTAGSVSTLLFIAAEIPMLMKAVKTRNLRSYSLSYMILMNIGNVLYWLYVGTLPMGPVWLIHSFYTLTSALMLLWYLRYEWLHRAAQVNTL